MLISLTLTLAAATQPVDFRTEILPVLEARCFECHQGGAKKPKAGLRLDGADWIRHGAGGSPVLVAGRPEESSLLARIALPADDLDVMPPKGDPLTKDEVERFRRWIAEGADFGDWTGAVGPETAGSSSAKKVNRAARIALWKRLGEGVKPVSQIAPELAAIAQVEPVFPGSPLVRVAFLSYQDEVTDDALRHVETVRANVAHLDLSRTRVTDAGVKKLVGASRLTHLDLHSTVITDRCVKALGELSELRSLNLHDTAVTDQALEQLAGLANLETLYVWKTKVTREGVAALERAKPGLRVQWRRDLPDPVPEPIED